MCGWSMEQLDAEERKEVNRLKLQSGQKWGSEKEKTRNIPTNKIFN